MDTIENKILYEIKKMNEFYKEKFKGNEKEVIERVRSEIKSVKDLGDMEDIIKEILEEY